MPGPLIRLGDKTSHQGAVLEASAHSDSGGVGIARVGDIEIKEGDVIETYELVEKERVYR